MVWHLTEGPKDHLLLHPDYERSMHVSQFRAVRLDDPLRHEMVTAALTSAQQALANALYQIHVPADAGRSVCREALKIAGVTARTEDLAAVIRWRKTCGGAQASGPGFAEIYRLASGS